MDNAGSCRAPQLAAPHSSWKLGSEWQNSIKVSIKVQGRFDKKNPICLEGDIYNYEKEFLEEVSNLAVQCDASKPASLKHSMM